MTHPIDTPQARTSQPAHEVLTMFRIEPRSDNGAFLELTSRDDSGRFTVQRFTLDQLMVCALQGAMARELGHIETPPLRPEYAALLAADPSQAAARSIAAEACSRLLYRQIFPADDRNSA